MTRSPIHLPAGFAAMALALLACQPLFAADIHVEGDCTLVDAIRAAEADAVRGGCPAGSGVDRIFLPGAVAFDSVYETTARGPNALPQITTEIEVLGSSSFVFRSTGADPFRFFEVTASGRLTLDRVILVGGYTGGGHPLVTNGGAILNFGEVRMHRSTVWLNEAQGYGGGIFSSGTLTLEDSTVFQNSASDGGGIHNTGTLTLVRTKVQENSVTSAGGGVHSGDTLEVVECHFDDNDAITGGGLHNTGDAVVTSSLFTGNTASSGGALLNYVGEAEIVNSTFTGNTASVDGGAIDNRGTMSVEFSTLSGNRANGSTPPVRFAGIDAEFSSDTTVTSTIITNSLQGSHCREAYITDGGNNLGCFGDEVTGFDTALKDNGGSTETHALLSYSNAIDEAGACAVAVDQRGAEREGACDSGAFEYGECFDWVLRDQDVTTYNPLAVCEYFWLGPDVDVRGPTGHLRATAGKMLIIRNGFSVSEGGQLTLTIDPTGWP